MKEIAALLALDKRPKLLKPFDFIQAHCRKYPKFAALY